GHRQHGTAPQPEAAGAPDLPRHRYQAVRNPAGGAAPERGGAAEGVGAQEEPGDARHGGHDRTDPGPAAQDSQQPGVPPADYQEQRERRLRANRPGPAAAPRRPASPRPSRTGQIAATFLPVFLKVWLGMVKSG